MRNIAQLSSMVGTIWAMTELPWQAAESIAESHLHELGFFRVRRTSSGADGGIDVLGDDVAAQVKLMRAPVGSPDIQRLRGAAHRMQAVAFYAHHSSGYSRAALKVAAALDVALFTFTLDGRVTPANEFAAELESPRRAVARVLDQSLVATARSMALLQLVREAVGVRKEALLAKMAEARAALAADEPTNVQALKDEADAMIRDAQAAPSVEHMRELARRLNEIVEIADGANLVELMQTPWRGDVTEYTSRFHDAVDDVTKQVLSWLGPQVEGELRQAAIAKAHELDASIEHEEVLRDWPLTPSSRITNEQ